MATIPGVGLSREAVARMLGTTVPPVAQETRPVDQARVRLTRTEEHLIQAMVRAGLTDREIRDKTGKSIGTIWHVRKRL